MKRIAIIGPYPKPYGGISVHLRNLNLYYHKFYSQKLSIIIYNTVFHHKQVDSFPNVIRRPQPPKLINSLILILNYNHRKNNFLLNFCSILNLTWYSIWLFKSLLIHRVKIIHFQGSASWDLRILTVIMAILTHSKSILSVHGAGIGKNFFQIQPLKKLTLKQKLHWIFIKKYDHIICDNTYQIRNLRSLKYSRDKISFIKEFIPPIIKNDDYKKIPKSIQIFYDKNEINLYGMGRIAKRYGVDVYGLDMMLELMYKIKKKYPKRKIGLTLKIIEPTKNSLKKLIENKERMGLNNILIVVKDIDEIYPLIEKADIMIRPSCTDGDSVSIREALYFNTSVLTSDAIPRPEGCFLFKNGDQNDFEEKLFYIIDKILKEKEKVTEKNDIEKSNAEKIIAVYKFFFKNKKET